MPLGGRGAPRRGPLVGVGGVGHGRGLAYGIGGHMRGFMIRRSHQVRLRRRHSLRERSEPAREREKRDSCAARVRAVAVGRLVFGVHVCCGVAVIMGHRDVVMANAVKACAAREDGGRSRRSHGVQR